MTHPPPFSPMFESKLIANQSSVILQKKVDRQAKESKIAIGLSKSLVDKGNKLSDSLVLKKMDSTRILGSETIDANQDHKRRCFEKPVVRRERTTQQKVEDFKCALEAEVVDDTALIVATSVITGFKNRYRNETDAGYGNHPGNDGKKKRSKGVKKQGGRCSMKCLNQKKSNSQGVEDKNTTEKKISEGKGVKKQEEGCSMKCLNQKKSNSQGDEDKNSTEQKISEGKGQKWYGKMSAKVNYVYQRKDTKNPKSIATRVEEHQNVLEKIFGEAMQETVVNLKVSTGIEKELITKSVETETVNLKVSTGIEKELITKLVETETVNEKDDGLKLNLIIAVHTKNNEAEDQNVRENTTVGTKKTAYSREEIEALRSVDEEGQKSKWIEVYSGFAPSVAREYTGLVVDANNWQTQRYNRVVNCGSARHANAILSIPPVLPLCSPSNCI